MGLSGSVGEYCDRRDKFSAWTIKEKLSLLCDRIVSFRHWKLLILVLIGVLISVVLIILIVVVARALLANQETSTLLDDVFRDRDIDMIDESQMMKRAQRMSEALSIKTVSYDVDEQESEELLKFHAFLMKSFPLVHSKPFIKREAIATHSLLFTVEGAVKESPAYLLTSHMDVVPADADNWEHPPFSGNIVDDTYIYGRGAMDAKTGVMGIMEALECMLQKGERPQRNLYIAFGHDEEVYGMRGAQEIGKALLERGVDHVDFLLDEGMPVSSGVIPGTDQHIAMIGISEKGTATYDLTVQGLSRHSSTPPTESAIGILADAVSRLEKNQLPSMLGGGVDALTFGGLAPHCSFGYRLIYSNLWLFSGLMTSLLEQDPVKNALVRTTTGFTIITSGIKDNVVPAVARAVVNHRIHESQTIADVDAHHASVVTDERVQFKMRADISREVFPLAPSGLDDVAYQLVVASIKQVFKDAVVLPNVLIGNTDTRWYQTLTRNIYRFIPAVVTAVDASSIHGNNERIRIQDYQLSVNFYYRLMKNADLTVELSQKKDQ